MHLLFPSHDHQATVYADASRKLGRGTFMTRARELAERLPEQAHCLNLCEDRLSFMLGFCAALLRGQCTVLPVNRTESSLLDVARRYPGIAALYDADIPPSIPGLNPLRMSAVRTEAESPEFDAGIPAATVVAELYTSGSTGQPGVHRKTWGMLIQGARMLGSSLGGPTGTLLSSVPSQHMFGLESSVLLPMQSGLGLAGGCPLLPQDIQSAMLGLGDSIWWATTPLHLRTCVKSGLEFPRLAGILCATQSLDADLARAAEDCFQAPLHEIYGSTETGVIGVRRPAQSVPWRLLPDWELHQVGEHAWISGDRCPAPLRLSDHIELLADGRFLLHGRHAELIKVGGKRMHLDALNRILTSIPGVQDGVFCQLVEGGRLTALVVAANPDSRALLAELRKQIDPVFLPRPIHWVSALPRNAMGKLPLDALRRFVAQLT